MDRITPPITDTEKDCPHNPGVKHYNNSLHEVLNYCACCAHCFPVWFEGGCTFPDMALISHTENRKYKPTTK